jgi:ring-1,2-phenylacetyl-CoA epoxidase subunit PaaE
MQFHDLAVTRITAQTADAVALTLQVPPALRERFAFRPGQFLTLRAMLDGIPQRRSYSICSSSSRYTDRGELEVGIKRVPGGAFSNWVADHLKVGDKLSVAAPDGRFTPRAQPGAHRVGFAAGSGITPMLSIIATTLEADPLARFTLIYGNQRVASIMFHEELQDLKDRFAARLTLVHLLSRQPQEVGLLNGRLDRAKVAELLRTVLPPQDIDEVFICGPEGMIEATEAALREAGVAPQRIHAERFVTAGQPPQAAASPRAAPLANAAAADVELHVVLDGKTHQLGMGQGDHVLDVALASGLDLPYSCKGGVCCTCRARVLEGQVHMDRNFTLEPWEIEKGFVLTCQARPLTPRVVVSYDER